MQKAITYIHQLFEWCERRCLCSRREATVDLIARIMHICATITANVSNTIDLRYNAVTAT